MRKNIIDGVKPFSDFYFKTCYYHQLIAALSCFGIAAENVLMNTLMLAHDNFVVEDRDYYTDKELVSKLGCKIKKCNINQRALVRNIDKGNPIIVGIDCFYLESRTWTYMQRHDPHYILAYGYDLDKDIAYVVDQDFANDSKYKIKTMPLSNLLYASEQFRRGKMCKKYTSRIISNKNSGHARVSIYDFIPAEQILLSKAASKNNLTKLKQMLREDTETLQKQIKKINDYIYSLKRYFFTVTKANFFQETERSEQLSNLIGAYGLIQAAMWKVNIKHCFDLTPNQIEKLVHNIDQIIELEDRVYTYIAEVCR
ncbi:MAG: BtrH N-terminal domain-containing protein [Clostridiales bacterium]|nr:BtrH N-terminal domain-containing protein [Clostridiales bacterium]